MVCCPCPGFRPYKALKKPYKGPFETFQSTFKGLFKAGEPRREQLEGQQDQGTSKQL